MPCRRRSARAFRTPAQVEADIDIRCVVITGAGEGFCSGADLKERKELDESRWQYVELVDRALLDIENSVPVIAAVNGHALGGGTELALGAISASLSRPRISV